MPSTQWKNHVIQKLSSIWSRILILHLLPKKKRKTRTLYSCWRLLQKDLMFYCIISRVGHSARRTFILWRCLHQGENLFPWLVKPTHATLKVRGSCCLHLNGHNSSLTASGGVGHSHPPTSPNTPKTVFDLLFLEPNAFSTSYSLCAARCTSTDWIPIVS